MNGVTRQELKERQGWTLPQKIDHSLGVIDQFLSRTEGKAYVSFSGGKDSTVLLHLCRIIKPDIKAVFCNTGNEYPDIVRFVRNTENVQVVRPKITPNKVFENYGFPLISKDVSEHLYIAKKYPNSKKGKELISGTISTKYRHKIPDRGRFLLGKDFYCSHLCCAKLKKDPLKKYEKENNVHPIMGIMASESNMRSTDYVHRGGCNVLEGGRVSSHPLSIWNEADIFSFIDSQKLPIADIYAKGVTRTGCMFCGFGCYHKSNHSLQVVYDLYPKAYRTFMNRTNNGITYREALRCVMAVTGKYLPDEKPRDLFSL